MDCHRGLLASLLLSTASVSGGQVSAAPAANSVSAYRLSGDRSLRPSQISDDGAKMYLTWPADAELPAIFALDSRGQEIMVDVWMRDGRLVIDAVHPRLVFRLDRQIARAERLVTRR